MGCSQSRSTQFLPVPTVEIILDARCYCAYGLVKRFDGDTANDMRMLFERFNNEGRPMLWRLLSLKFITFVAL